MTQYNKEVAQKIREYALKNEKYLEDHNEHTIIMMRRLVCDSLIGKMKLWLLQHNVKDFKVEIEEYSNIRPLLKVSLKSKSKVYTNCYDKYGIYFDREKFLYSNRGHTEKNCRLWLPNDWWTFLDKHSKANDLIMEEFMKEFTIEKVGIYLNYPFFNLNVDSNCWEYTHFYNLT